MLEKVCEMFRVGKTFCEGCLIPFIAGFLGVSIIFFVQINMSNDSMPPRMTPIFKDKRGQEYLELPGVQKKDSDIFRLKSDTLRMSVVAEASEGFTKMYIANGHGVSTGIANNSAPTEDQIPGAIWSWPRLEEEASPTPLVWVCTPTHRYPYQYAELTRIAQALYPARTFVRWIVVDDTNKTKKHEDPQHFEKLYDFLSGFQINVTLLKSIARPVKQKIRNRTMLMGMSKGKGVNGRRTALSYIRRNKLEGVVYFADDDNTYDSDIFRQMQLTKTVSIWPTGAITEWIVSSPVVSEEGVVVDLFDAFTVNRQFPVDFASFAVHTDLIFQNPEANIRWISGYGETTWLTSLNVDKETFQPLAANATEVLTWHTKTVKMFADSRLASKKKSRSLSGWPTSLMKLMNKYDFLYDKY